MGEEKVIDLLALEILPLANSGMLRKAFVIEDPDFQHLITWLKTKAWHSQEEKKSKTYIATYKSDKIGFISLSNGFLEGQVEGIRNTTSFKHQVLLVGKLYITPEYRGYGLGNKLLSFALDIAARLNQMTGCLGIIVNSNSNPKTVNFYKKFGFVDIDKEEDAGIKTIRMFFKLPS